VIEDVEAPDDVVRTGKAVVEVLIVADVLLIKTVCSETTF
jgi:hypothetical protein